MIFSSFVLGFWVGMATSFWLIRRSRQQPAEEMVPVEVSDDHYGCP